MSSAYPYSHSAASRPGSSSSAHAQAPRLAAVEDPGVNVKKVEAELEAERLWWSEASERQVKELESTFGEEFKKTTARMRTDLAAVQDRLETMFEQEKKQRHASLAELRRELDNQQVTLTTTGQQQLIRINSLEAEVGVIRNVGKSTVPVAQHDEAMNKVHDAHRIIAGLRSDIDLSQSQRQVETSRIQADFDRNQQHLSATEAALQDLRRELSTTQEKHSTTGSQLELIVKELQQDVSALRERTHLQAESNQEVQALHQVMVQSAGDLGRGIEEVSAAVLATEQKLRKELQVTRTQLEAADTEQSRKILEALESSSERLARGLARAERGVADERDQRALEAQVFRSQCDGWREQMEEVQASVKSLMGVGPSIRPEEVDTLRQRFDRLEATMPAGEVQSTKATAEMQAAVQKAEELASAAGERSTRLEQTQSRMENRLADQFAEERSKRAAELTDVRKYAEDLAKRAQQAHAESVAIKGAAEQAVAVGVSSAEVEDVRAELATVKAELQTMDGDMRRCAAVATRVEMETQSLEKESIKHSAMADRMEALEVRSRKSAAAASRVEALEAEFLQAARASEVRHLESEVRRLANGIAPMVSKIESVEADTKKAAREVSPLTARLAAAESELSRITRDYGPLHASVDTLTAEVEAVKTRLLVLPAILATKEASRQPAAVASPSAAAATSTSAAFASSPSSPTTEDPKMTSLSRTKDNRYVSMPAVAAPPSPITEEGHRDAARKVMAVAAAAEKERLAAERKAQGPSPLGRRGLHSQALRPASPVPAPTGSSFVFSATPAIPVAAPASATSGQNDVLPILSDDLKESIHMLVKKVNTTLANSIEAVDAGSGTVPSGSTATPSQRQQVPAGRGLETPIEQEGFMRALQAVQELREKNLTLREENAELAEELLAQDGLMTPGSIQGLALPHWPPSQQHSASATPSQLQPQSAQPVLLNTTSPSQAAQAAAIAVALNPNARDRAASVELRPAMGGSLVPPYGQQQQVFGGDVVGHIGRLSEPHARRTDISGRAPMYGDVPLQVGNDSLSASRTRVIPSAGLRPRSPPPPIRQNLPPQLYSNLSRTQGATYGR